MSSLRVESVVSDIADPATITLSSLAEAGQAESTIPVLNQQTYTGQVITSTLADTLCTDLRISEGLYGPFLDPSRMLTPTNILTVPPIPLFSGRRFFSLFRVISQEHWQMTIQMLNQQTDTSKAAIISTIANAPCTDIIELFDICGLDDTFALIDDIASLPPMACFRFDAGTTQSTILAMLKQRSYTSKAVIISTLANTSCTDLSVDEVIRGLGFRDVGRRDMIQEATNQSEILSYYDFGTAYAHLRHVLHDTISIEGALRCLKRDWEQRRNLVVDNKIAEWIAVPRRVWDLRANRVVPWWVVNTWPWGISHAWVCDGERIEVMTPINGYEWPVPIPKGANLDLVRIEMLNLGAEYAWLDVLCLRQAGGRRDDLRAKEWEIDVPTIGAVYHMAPKVVCYFSGLGRPLSLTPDDFESKRSWFRRAWTLQEVTDNPIIGGETGNHGTMAKDIRMMFHEKLQPLQTIRAHGFLGIFKILLEMQNRMSEKALDKVAGLAYLLKPKHIPTYDATQCEEDAWVALVKGMQVGHRLELLFLYPEPGDRRKYWHPSWNQVMTKTLPDARRLWFTNVVGMDETDTDWVEAHCIETADVLGLANGSNKEKPRKGELVVQDNTGAPRTFNILADHAFPIPDGAYTHIGSTRFGKISHHLVVGRWKQGGKFKKLSVIRLADNEEIWSLQKLKAAQRFVKISLC